MRRMRLLAAFERIRGFSGGSILFLNFFFGTLGEGYGVGIKDIQRRQGLI